MSLNISNLYKGYNQGTDKIEILKNLNASIKTGEVVAILGASGSGKSTLLSLVAGLDDFSDGDILIGNQSIKNLNRAEMTSFRSKNIGFIFQQFHLVSHLNAFENLALPLEILNLDFNDDTILQALNDVGLGHRKDHLPSQLSGGECQRLAIARGLITKPKLLLADEPSGNLDAVTGQKVMNLFFKQIRQSQTTTVLVTHDVDLAKQCDRILYLKNGVFES